MFKNKFFTTVLYVLCGILCAIPFIFNDLWFLGWLAYIPVLTNEYLRQDDDYKPYKKAWLRGLSFFYPFGITTFFWILELYPMDFVGFTPAMGLLVVSMAIIGVPLFQSLFTSFNIVLLTFLKKNKVKWWLYPILAACMWIIQEWLQTLTWAGIPWGKLAIGQVGVLQNVQSASLFGSYFVSFIIIAFGGFIAIGIANFKGKDTKKRGWISIALAAVLFASNFTFGAIAISQKPEYKNEFKAAAIQGNIDTPDKWGADIDFTINAHVDLIKQAAQEGANIVVLAETALPYNITQEQTCSSMINSAKEYKTDIIVGCYTQDDEYRVYNSTVFVSKTDGITDQVYNKQKLVPFGEYVPMRAIITTVLPFLNDINMLEIDVTPGTQSDVFETQYGKIGSLICFDSIYESVAWQSVNDGAEILMLSTNDAWFHDSAAAYQHNAQARLRAIELGRYVVRAGNTGVSSIITEKGEIVDQLDALESGYAIGNVKTTDSNTLYSIVGNLIVAIAILVTIVEICLLIIKRNRINKRNAKVKEIEYRNRKS